MSERDRILDKLKKMYAHSKSAEAIGSEEEAKAFAAKVQELLSQHKIELSEIEYQKLDETDPVIRRRVDFKSAGIKIKQKRVDWHEHMASFTCRAYFCKFIVVTGSSELYFAGRGTDIDAAEQVFLYLVRVAGHLADAAYVKYFYEARAAGDVGRARGFRASYLNGFTLRLAERYDEEREKIRKQHAESGTALVRLTDAVKVVDNYLDELRRSGQTKKAHSVGNSSKEENEEGYSRGRKEASELPIGDQKKQVRA